MTAKVESRCMKMPARSVNINGSERACVNCIWYEQYYRKNRGNVACWVPTSSGYCLLKETQRGPLRQPCLEFEIKKEKGSLT